MYRILLVDDEPDVLEYFGRIFRENLGSKMDVDVYSVDSAYKALDYFREFKADIVVSDIQMPEMSGMELYKELKRQWSQFRMIFLTGYMNFDYVYEAAQDGRTRFLTKLEPLDKIVSTVIEVLEEIEQDYREQTLLMRALEQGRQAIPLLQNKALGQLLYGRVGKEQLGALFKKAELDLNLDQKIFLLGIDLDQMVDTMEQEHLGFVQKTIMISCFDGAYRLWNYLSEAQTVPYIWVLQKNEGCTRNFTEFLELVQKKFQKNTKNSISFSYGEISPPYENLSQFLRRIQSILGYRDTEITENIIPCPESLEKACIVPENPVLESGWQCLNLMGELESYFETGNEKRFFEVLERLTVPLEKCGSMNSPMALEIYFQIALLLQRYMNLWQLNEKMAFHIETYKLFRIDMYESWMEAVSFLKQLSHLIFDLYFAEERDGMNNYIADVKNYVREHLDADLTLLMLAEKVHLNASYLSRLFHKMTGEKLYDYILALRMDRAKELILKNQMKIQEIAQSVGYESVQSFNRAFKKYAGMSPVDYRNYNV